MKVNMFVTLGPILKAALCGAVKMALFYLCVELNMTYS